MTSALGGETNSMEEKRDISDFLSCSENQALLDHLLKEEKKAPYAKGVGPYHAASIRKVISSVRECSYPIKTMDDMRRLRGVGKVLSKKLASFYNIPDCDGSAGSSEMMRPSENAKPTHATDRNSTRDVTGIEKRARLISYKPEPGKGPWWMLYSLHALGGVGTKSDVAAFIKSIKSPNMGTPCPPLSEWWGNALKQLQSKHIIEKGAIAGKRNDGLEYRLTNDGVDIAQGLVLCSKDSGNELKPLKQIVSKEEDLVEAAFSEISRDASYKVDKAVTHPFEISSTSRKPSVATSIKAGVRNRKDLISLISDSDEEMETEELDRAASFSQSIYDNFERVNIQDSGSPNSLSPPHCRRKYSHPSGAAKELHNNHPAAVEMRWSPIHKEESPFHRKDSELCNKTTATSCSVESPRNSIDGDFIVLALDNPWSSEESDDMFLLPSKLQKQISARTPISSTTASQKREVVDLMDSPFVNTSDRLAAVADPDNWDLQSEKFEINEDINRNIEKKDEVAREYDEDLGVGYCSSSTDEDKSDDEAQQLPLRERLLRLEHIRKGFSSLNGEKHRQIQASSCFERALVSCGIRQHETISKSSSSGTSISNSESAGKLQYEEPSPADLSHRSIVLNASGEVVNISDDYEYFQRVEDNDFWGDQFDAVNADSQHASDNAPSSEESKSDIGAEMSYKLQSRLEYAKAALELGGPTTKPTRKERKDATKHNAFVDKMSSNCGETASTLEIETNNEADCVWLPFGWWNDWEVVLLVDIREKENATIQSHLIDHGVLCETAQLALGDFLWAARRKLSTDNLNTAVAEVILQQRRLDSYALHATPTSEQVDGQTKRNEQNYVNFTEVGESADEIRKTGKRKPKSMSKKDFLNEMIILDCIIERKTAADLASSIIDGRYKEQSNRLVKCGIRVPGYIIEGLTLSKSSRGGYSHVTREALESAMVAIQVKGIDVQRTRGIDHTISLLVAFHKHVTDHFQRGLIGHSQSGDAVLMTYPQFQRRNAKTKTNLTMVMLLASQLRQIPGCSEEAAKAVAMTFGTMFNLISFVNEKGNKKQTVQFIADIRRMDGQNRRVGQKLADYIVDLFGSDW